MLTWTTLIIYISLAVITFQSRLIVRLLDFIKLMKFSHTIPGPPFTELFDQSRKKRLFDWMIECRYKYGPLFGIWFANNFYVYVTDPTDAQTVLSSSHLIYKASNYDMVVAWLGRGLLTNGGESWHNRRKLLTPAFHFKVLSGFREPIEDTCRILIDKLSEVADGNPIDIYPYITLYALDVICETAMGVKKNAQQNTESEYVKTVQGMCEFIIKRAYSLNRFDLIYFFSSERQTEKTMLRILHNETNRIIALRRKFLSDSNITNLTDAEQKTNRLAFLDMLLLTQNESGKLTDKNIREEVDTFMFEGHDTTSAAISWMIYLLSTHKDVQDRCYKTLTHESDSYLEAVIKETLRLYPSVPYHSRLVKEPIQLGNVTVPKGSNISIFQYMLHRDPNTYKCPEEFNPDRFLYGNDKDINPFAYVPFSAGPRNCIGQRFAMLELKCTMSNLIRAFEFMSVDDFVPKPDFLVILRSTNGIRVRLQKR